MKFTFIWKSSFFYSYNEFIRLHINLSLTLRYMNMNVKTKTWLDYISINNFYSAWKIYSVVLKSSLLEYLAQYFY